VIAHDVARLRVTSGPSRITQHQRRV